MAARGKFYIFSVDPNYCVNLESIVIPAGVERIDNGTFYLCESLKTVTFRGDAPAFFEVAVPDGENIFSGVTATVYYPANNVTWTEEVRQNYGGVLTWEPFDLIGGTCGENLTWTLENGVLTISGYGDMEDFGNGAPWADYREEITEIAIGDSAFSIGQAAFSGCSNVTSIVIPKLYKIGSLAFSNCSQLKEITFSAGPPMIAEDAFFGVTANVHYTVSLYWSTDDLKNYGGNMTWIEHGNDAKMLTISVNSEMSVGETCNIEVQAHPYDATAECIFSFSKEGIVEIISSEQRSATIRTIQPGEVTITARDKRTGLTVSDTINVLDTKTIECPYSEEIFVGAFYNSRDYTFTPGESGNYVCMITNLNEPYTDGCGFYVYYEDNYYAAESYLCTDDIIRHIYYFEAGSTYRIRAVCNSIQTGKTASFQFGRAEDAIESVSFLEDVIELDFAGEDYTSGWITAILKPFNAYSEVEWVSSDPDIVEITTTRGNECGFKAHKVGTAELTVICGGKSDSVKVVVHETTIELNETITLTSYGEYTSRYVAFTPAETARYVFTVQGDGLQYWDVGTGSYSSDDEPGAGYGEGFQTCFRKIEAGETCYLKVVFRGEGNRTVTVSKATEKVTGMSIVCLGNTSTRITLGAGFHPQTATEEVVKWEVSNPDILGRSRHDGSPRYNCAFYTPYGTGEVTVTATSASGLQASYTIAVEVAQSKHSYVFSITEPTCEIAGYTTYTCNICGDSYTAEYVEATGHVLGEGAIIKEATCDSDGLAEKICTVCNKKITSVIPAGHIDAGGICSRCGLRICGNRLSWTFDEVTNTLTISGEDEMYGYNQDNMPWAAFGDQIKKVSMQEGVTSVGGNAFYNCSSLAQVELPSTVMEIAYSAFENCTSLTEVDLPEKLISIGSSSFGNCTKLEGVVFPKNLQLIGEEAFGDCVNLKSIYFNGNAPFMRDCFSGVTANAYYPANDGTWTADVLQNYGGIINWIPYTSGDMNGDNSVDLSDAADLLWRTMFPEDDALPGKTDFNNDGVTDTDDVIYLLWAILFPDLFPL